MKFPRKLSCGANNTVFVISATEAGKLVLFFFFVIGNFAFAQYKNNKWLMGYNTNLPFGGTKIEFVNNQRIISLDPRSMWFSACYTGISDKNDNWFIYSNGTAVCNKNHDTLVNGNGLSPGGDRFGSLYGLQIPGQAVFLPFENENKIYLVHQNSKTSSPIPFGNQPHSLNLFYSIIDPLANNGQGTIFSKNNLVLVDTMEIGNLLSVRHANGRVSRNPDTTLKTSFRHLQPINQADDMTHNLTILLNPTLKK